jgi:hypothetical protein
MGVYVSTISTTTYAEKLKDPRWQKKRLKIFERDGWKCQCCLLSDSTLHVHHLRYITGKDPWEYPDYLLITLCCECHQNETEFANDELALLFKCLQERHYFWCDIYNLRAYLDWLPKEEVAWTLDQASRSYKGECEETKEPVK